MSVFEGNPAEDQPGEHQHDRQIERAQGNRISERECGEEGSTAENITNTTPMISRPKNVVAVPPANASREEYVARALEMIANTAPFDITHHPAMSLPCGMVDGLPVGLMLVGSHFDETTIYRAADAFEKAGDWKKM